MTTIGRFSEREDGALIGHIRTMFFKSDKVVFEPSELTAAEAPDFRIFTGDDIEIGAAWKTIAEKAGLVSYDVKLDDPTFANAVICRLTPSIDGADYLLVWERPTITTKAA